MCAIVELDLLRGMFEGLQVWSCLEGRKIVCGQKAAGLCRQELAFDEVESPRRQKKRELYRMYQPFPGLPRINHRLQEDTGFFFFYHDTLIHSASSDMVFMGTHQLSRC
jgi:hypothetical protein